MASNVVNPAESTTAEPNFDPSTWSAEQHETWTNTGAIPSSAESTPAPPPPAGEPDGSKPAAESAPASIEAQHPKGKGAEERKAQLAREIQESLDRRKAVQREWDEFEAYRKAKPDASAAPSPAKPEEPKKLARPVFGESGHAEETWDQFEVRRDAHTEALAEQKVQEALKVERDAREKERTEAETAVERKKIEESWQERTQAAVAALGITPEAFGAVAFTDNVPITQVMDGFILDSDHGPRILYHLGQNVEEAKQIAAMKPYAAARALTKIELSFATETPAPKQAGKAPVPITKAPRPETNLKATSASAPDPLKAAIEADDYAAFEAEANRRTIERRRKG